MVIRLAIVDQDQGYLSRISTAFQAKYADKIELYTFTNPEKALEAVGSARINVLLASPACNAGPGDVPPSCGFAYLVDSPDIDTYDHHRAVCKYQKVETIYRAITDIYADSSDDRISKADSGSGFPVFLFVSAGGGAGASTAAAAAALSLASRGKKPLYLSLDLFGNADLYFEGEGKSHLGDVIYAVKGRRGNLHLKLESSVKRDFSGVFFYSAPENALHVNELSAEDLRSLFHSLGGAGFCDCAIVDTGLSLDEKTLFLLGAASRIVFVSDGTGTANTKLERAVDALRMLEKDRGPVALHKSALFYNKFSNKSGRQVDIHELPILGGAPRFEHLSSSQVIQRLVDESLISPVAECLAGGLV